MLKKLLLVTAAATAVADASATSSVQLEGATAEIVFGVGTASPTTLTADDWLEVKSKIASLEGKVTTLEGTVSTLSASNTQLQAFKDAHPQTRVGSWSHWMNYPSCDQKYAEVDLGVISSSRGFLRLTVSGQHRSGSSCGDTIFKEYLIQWGDMGARVEKVTSAGEDSVRLNIGGWEAKSTTAGQAGVFNAGQMLTIISKPYQCGCDFAYFYKLDAYGGFDASVPEKVVKNIDEPPAIMTVSTVSDQYSPAVIASKGSWNHWMNYGTCDQKHKAVSIGTISGARGFLKLTVSGGHRYGNSCGATTFKEWLIQWGDMGVRSERIVNIGPDIVRHTYTGFTDNSKSHAQNGDVRSLQFISAPYACGCDFNYHYTVSGEGGFVPSEASSVANIEDPGIGEIGV